MSRRHFIAVNAYRNSTTAGFANTWDVYECDRETQKRLLSDGLPLPDRSLLTENGRILPELSTIGIRAATREEIRNVRRCESFGETPRRWNQHPGYGEDVTYIRREETDL